MPLPLIPVLLGLSQFAPSLLRFMGAGQTTQALADKVAQVAQTVSGAATPEEALASIQANAQLQAEFQRRVLDLDAELEQAYLADVADARKRDMAFLAAGRRNGRADLMVLFDVVGLIACLVVLTLFRTEIPAEVSGLLTTIASIFGLCLRDAHQFEFGSSRGSREKDELLGLRAGKAAPPQP